MISDPGFRTSDLRRRSHLARRQIRNPNSEIQNPTATYSRLRDQAGLPRDLVLYLARHECGTKICREKGIEYARRLLGHANISTTQRYMHLDDRELADAQDLVE
jgi:site-specific recombinase XerD